MNNIQKPFLVKRSSAGLGLFAQKEFTKDERIIEYTGERISHDEANARGGLYLFILNDNIVIDGKGRENTARYVNHSCKPNAEAIYEEEDEKVYIVAKKKILPSDEITYHYGKEYWNAYIKPKGCKCSYCLTQ